MVLESTDNLLGTLLKQMFKKIVIKKFPDIRKLRYSGFMLI
jgi:hypothetical protein